ncbi:MAG: LysR family transcriptional regulator [Propionibacteriaceae bacterium]|nr:LysR family transcriptional regulator [Propionibacteriaceae bacterium]
MDPRRLLIFKTVAEAGSMSAGARALGWTQPSVTAHIRALERSVGVPLLLRSPQGVRVTEAGQMVLLHAAQVAASLDTVTREADEFRHARRGVVRLACFQSFLSTAIPAALRQIHDATGTWAEVRVTEARPADALAALAKGDVDIAVVCRHDGDLAAPPWEGYHVTALSWDECCLAVPVGHWALDAASLTLADLRDERWVFGSVACRDFLLGTCRQAGFDPNIRHVTDDYVAVQALVALGLTVAPVTTSALRAYQHPGVATRALPEFTGHTVSALCHPGAERIPSVATLLRALAGSGAVATE